MKGVLDGLEDFHPTQKDLNAQLDNDEEQSASGNENDEEFGFVVLKKDDVQKQVPKVLQNVIIGKTNPQPFRYSKSERRNSAPTLSVHHTSYVASRSPITPTGGDPVDQPFLNSSPKKHILISRDRAILPSPPKDSETVGDENAKETTRRRSFGRNESDDQKIRSKSTPAVAVSVEFAAPVVGQEDQQDGGEEMKAPQKTPKKWAAYSPKSLTGKAMKSLFGSPSKSELGKSDIDEIDYKHVESVKKMLVLARSVRQLCVQHSGRIELADELKASIDRINMFCQENVTKIRKYYCVPRIMKIVFLIHRTLESANQTLTWALKVQWRRNSKFRDKMLFICKDAIDNLTQLELGLEEADVGKDSFIADSDTSGGYVSKGQLESLEGDRALFGHGVPQNYEIAYEHYEKASSLGYGRAMNSLACMLRDGLGPFKDVKKAVKWFERSVQLDCLDAMNNLGQILEGRHGIKKDIPQAIELFTQAAVNGNLDAMTNLGFLYENGSEDDLPVDLEVAEKWYSMAAELGYSKAQNNLGCLLHRLGKDQNEKDEAINWLKIAAKQGNAAAMNNLGKCYETGTSVEEDQSMAMHLYSRAADQSNAQAMSNLGYIYLQKMMYSEAFNMFRKSADLKNVEALFYLGQMFDNGLFVTKCPQTAAGYYKAAAELNHPYAQLKYGDCLFSGRGAEKDLTEAYKYYTLSAAQGISEAENNLGIMCEEGIGTKQDFEEAKKWFSKAARKDNEDAIFNIGSMLKKGKCGEENQEKAVNSVEEATKLGSTEAKFHLIAEQNGSSN